MLTNDIKKGMRVQMANGWFGTMMDNKKGNIRMVEVEGIHTETGSVYSHDIVSYINSDGVFVDVEHTKEQLAQKEYIKNGGW